MVEAIVALTKPMVADFLVNYKLMSVATNGEFPWIASVYYAFDQDLNLYFLSAPTTIHAKQIIQNHKVSVAVCDSHQDVNQPKKGLQLSGIAKQLSDPNEIKYALQLWKAKLGKTDDDLSYERVKTSMFKITPKIIKLFDQERFRTKDGEEPILNL